MPLGSPFPQVQIASDQLAAQLYLPDTRNGFYQGTRFDWSGVLAGLQYLGHPYYAPWYTKCCPRFTTTSTTA